MTTTPASPPAPRWRTRLLVAISIGFVGYKAYEAIGPILPEPYTRDFPWGVFTAAQRYNIDYVIAGETAEGKPVAIDLHRWFTYTRGFARLYVYQEHGGISSDSKQLRAFARWVAQRVWKEDGLQLKRVHVEQHRAYVDKRGAQIKHIASVDIRSEDYEQQVPRSSAGDEP